MSQRWEGLQLARINTGNRALDELLNRNFDAIRKGADGVMSVLTQIFGPTVTNIAGNTVTQITNIIGSALDHLVIVTREDPTPGTVEETTTVGPGLVADVVTEDGRLKRRFSLRPQDSVADGMKLWPCEVPDLLLRAPVKGLLPYGEGTAFESTWDAVSGALSTWQAKTAGPLYLRGVAGPGANIQAQTGWRALSWAPVPYGNDAKYFGPYEIVDPGYKWVANALGGKDFVYTKAIIRRPTDANTPATLCHGMVVQVTGGEQFDDNGQFFTLTTADPIVVDVTELTFAESSSYTAQTKRELLTSSQLGAPTTTPEYEQDGSLAAPGRDLIQRFVSRALGMTSLAAGTYKSEALSRWVSRCAPSLGTTLQVDLAILNAGDADDATKTAFLTLTSAPLTSMSADYAQLVWQGNGTVQTILETDRIRAEYYLASTDASAEDWQAARLMFDPSNGQTVLTAPWGIPGGANGTSDHEQLANRLGKGSDGKAYHLTSTQWKLLTRSVTTEDLTISGTVLTLSDACGAAKVTGSDLRAIATTGRYHDEVIRLTFTGACSVGHGASVSLPMAPIWQSADGPGTQLESLDVRANSTVWLRYRTDLGAVGQGVWLFEGVNLI